METQEFITSNEKIEFRQIVLGHLKKILDISFKKDLDSEERITMYVHSIKTFSDILLPFFDIKMDTYYKQYIKEYKDLRKETCDNGCVKNDSKYYPRVKSIHRNLFKELNLLMKRVDYLKGTVYGENINSELIEVDKD